MRTKKLPGLARTARGPSMSASPGKVEIQGVTDFHGERVFVLRFIQARNPEWVQRPFFAAYDPDATWLDDLLPAGGAERFPYEEEYEALCAAAVAHNTTPRALLQDHPSGNVELFDGFVRVEED